MSIRARQKLGFRGLAAVIVVLALGLAGLVLPASLAGADVYGCPCSLFGPTEGPTGSDVESADPASVELGVQFTVDAAVPITGMRFYKGVDNTGTHVGSIWSADGTLLTSATFTSETASGWQQVSFATPVMATPGTTYVASYFAPNGHYAYTYDYFSTSGHDSGILHAPGGNTSTPNGLFVYTPVPAFPNATFNGTNYWVDVVVGTPTVLTSITLNPTSLSLVKGASAPVTATGTYSDGTSSSVMSQASWTSGDPTVATVSSTGVVTAVGPGSTTVSATVGGVTRSIPVSVKAVTAVRIGGLPTSQAAGLSTQLSATAVYSDGSTQDVTSTATWSSTNPAVAKVSATGLLTAVGVGTATISAGYAGITGSGSTSVTPASVVSLCVVPSAATIRVASILRLTATATYTDGTTRDVTSSATWRFSNLLVAVVTSGKIAPGIVLPVLPGRTTVSATYAGVTATVPITVVLL